MLRSMRADLDPSPAPTRRARLQSERRLRSRRRTTAVVATMALLASALPSAAAAGGTTGRTADDTPGGAPEVVAENGGVVALDGGGALPLPDDRGAVRALATVEDADAWCAHLSSYYLAFPSPWSARVINCRSSDLFVAPVYSDASLGMCVLVPARHSRHLGGNVTRWVTDIRLC
ncbi:hypothetical protein Cfla_2403 [Cellulomonas flavigena DSM 20109]|uniref:Uncharacterized protein n=1 Tax=Cellulomonas flavigena (strain ATCC 482 / DSM 20109 / BCRC 11376 / JCM 18109 / NBRC 3775 / NCIMB 8073 / NRS 134) TaxID=446466 RepID=D5UHH2_CELFN|nr:hypothetical protein [Cellulomonas flavigena]ADG75293.1 hypothetical protein Cfla_2403 [Cellulomonas flavigena DSM 20109]